MHVRLFSLLAAVKFTSTAVALPASATGGLLKRDPPSTSDSAFIEEALSKHNSHRAKHDADPLSWNADLASKASAQATTGSGQHTANSGYGENLYGFGGTNSEDSDFIAKTGEAIDAWYNEVNGYDPATESGAGHFTQVVWKATERVGCAWSGRCDSDIEYYMYCVYDPAGNVGGQYADNVTP